MSDREAAEEALRRSEERFRALVEHSNGVVDHPARWHRHLSRPRGHRHARLPPGGSGRKYECLDFVHPDDVDELREQLRAIAITRGGHATSRGGRRTGRRLAPYRMDRAQRRRLPGVEGIIFNAHDVTEARRLEEQLRQAQKMEAVGPLAGGIAHDFNNILGAILGFASFLLEDLPRGSEERGFAQRIITASERAKDLVQQILAFSRRTGVERKPTDITRVTQETLDLLRASLPSSTQLQVRVAEQPLVADVNAAQISQLVLNLCLNANDALQGEPGRISIEIAAASADAFATVAAQPGEPRKDRLRPHRGRGARPPAKLRGDHGRRYRQRHERGGAAAHIRSVLHHQGARARHRPRARRRARDRSRLRGRLHRRQPARRGVGVLGLPAARRRGPLACSADGGTASLRGRERVLVIDDEADVRDVLTIGLDRLGYEVVALDDPREALSAVTGPRPPGTW